MIVFNEDEDSKNETDVYFFQIIAIGVLGTLFFVLSGIIFPKNISDVYIPKININSQKNDDSARISDNSVVLHDEFSDSVAIMFYAMLEEKEAAIKPALEQKEEYVKEEKHFVEKNIHADVLGGFFSKLYALETSGEGVVRIAYYGDSMIEGDYIVQTIRSLFQKKYGGKGVGIVPVSLAHTSARQTVKHTFSTNWQYSSVMKRNALPLGIAACVSFCPEGESSWVSYQSGTQKIVNPTLLYGKSDNKNAKALVTSSSFEEEVALNPDKKLNFLRINGVGDSIVLEFIDAQNIPFFGINFSQSKGVYIDNFSVRGSSGLPLIHLEKDIMNAFHKSFDYDLVILQFGANVIRQDVKTYKWYSEKMVKVVEHLRECFPGADVLVISAADKAAKYGAEIKTDSLVYPLLRSQREYANITNSGFINLFQLMGGEGTMAQWVSMDPPLGSKDLVHFSYPGTNIIANKIYEKLDSQYRNYKKNIEKGIR